jgi:hypothetical protein
MAEKLVQKTEKQGVSWRFQKRGLNKPPLIVLIPCLLGGIYFVGPNDTS